MDVLGAVFFILLPYMAGYICKNILRWKETNQIETYLIGFFFLFFLQGIVLIPCVWMGKSLKAVCNIFYGCFACIVVLCVAFLIPNIIRCLRREKKHEFVKTPRKMTERIYFLAMLLVFLLIVLRMVLALDALREDVVLETVLTTVKADSLYVMHPLTGRAMEAGMIASKKIVTPPLFYACMVKMSGLDADVLLYVIMGTISLIASYYALSLLFSRVSNVTRSKQYVFWLIYGLLILSGDYCTGVLPYQMLYRGYDGSTICFSVILPYLLYIVISWYKSECEEEKTLLSERVMYSLKIMLCFASSVVITGLGTGFLFLFMAMAVAGICCLLKSIQEVRACRES